MRDNFRTWPSLGPQNFGRVGTHKLDRVEPKKFTQVERPKFNHFRSDKFSQIEAKKFKQFRSDKFSQDRVQKFNQAGAKKFNQVGSKKFNPAKSALLATLTLESILYFGKINSSPYFGQIDIFNLEGLGSSGWLYPPIIIVTYYAKNALRAFCYLL